MKKLILLLLVILSSINFSQVSEQWNPVCTTYVPTLDAENLALFVNNNGIHVLQLVPTVTTTTVKYYRLKSNGDLDDGITVDGIEIDDYGKFPNLVGDEQNLFAVYQKGGNVIIKKSTDGGDIWSPEASYEFPIGITVSNGVDAFYNNNGLHIVWSQKEGTIYESYFIRRKDNQWLNYRQVTDHTSLQSGGFPTLTSSSINGTQRVHVCINTTTGDFIPNNGGQNFSRDFDYSSWSAPNQILQTGTSMLDRLTVTNDGYLHCFYLIPSSDYSTLKYTKRTINPVGSRSAPSTVSSSINYTNLEKIELAKTNNELLNAFWMSGSPLGFYTRNKTSVSATWTAPFEINGGTNQRELVAASNSNDLYVIFSQNSSVPTLRLRQYDANPLTPKNFAGTVYNNNPKLNWSINSEADLSYYEIWRRFILDPKNPYSWSLLTTTTQTSFIDYDVFVGNGSWGDVEYKIRAKDVNNHLSGYSNIISFGFQGLQKSGSSSSNEINDYSLAQNYPNPFNPSTKISYSIKEEGLVTLKVYDVLGKEVATLVNENKPEGNYEVDFNASQLPSGMYVYSIQTGEFKESKKMLLMK